MGVSLSVVDAKGQCRCSFVGDSECFLAWRGEYRPGDVLVVECDEPSSHLEMQLDAELHPSHVLLRGGRFEFPVPFGPARKSYGERAFAGERHVARVRGEDGRALGNWRNLALNAFDLTPGEGTLEGSPLDGQVALFPHASTNVQPHNPQFIARNAIDGAVATERHGSWPHASWGVAGRDDAWLKVDFGEPVVADELRLYLRADFPHDTCWEEATVELSDGSSRVCPLEKTGAGQSFDLGGARIEWLKLRSLVKRDEPGFPGLAQLEVWGRREVDR